MHGFLVNFQAGAEVTSVKLVSDFSTIQITGLSANIEPTFVSDMLLALGFAVPTSNIVLKQLPAVGTVADVTVEDPSFARMVTQKYGQQQMAGVENGISIRTVSGGGSGTVVNRLQLSKVNCTWYEGSRSAWLLFGSRMSAAQASRRLQASTILGRVPSCSFQDQVYVMTRDTTLQINNLHPDTSSRDLSGVLRGHFKPSRITLGDPTHELFGEKAAAVIEKLLRTNGDLESFHFQTVEGTSKMKGTATFFERKSAASAVQSLHNTKIARLGNSKLLISHVVSVKYNVSTAIAEALKGQLEELRQTAWRKGNIQLKAYPQTNLLKPFTTLRLSGETAKNVADAKAALENLLAGTIVMAKEMPLWDPYFLTPGALADLNELSARHELFIYRDARKSQLLLYGGSGATRSEVQRILASKVDALHKLVHTIVLTPDLLKNAMQGGMRRLKARFGDAVGLNISVQPKLITITGSAEDLREARALLLNPSQSLTISISTAQASDCIVCWTEATDALNTTCGHVYCKDCFASQVTSASERDFPIHCEGAESQCQHIFSLEELKTMLSATMFESLLRASFDIYVRTRPQEFQHCPTPDCPQVYRLSNSGDTFLCSTCLTSVCTTCNVLSHDGLTCEEYKDISSEGTKAFQRWTRENDARPCPNCRILIEKAEGCNHMACSQCGTHICWACMNIYDTSQKCYGHMQEAHGKFGV
jgi:post-segregation antitoxin (ccd killing protein)